MKAFFEEGPRRSGTDLGVGPSLIVVAQNVALGSRALTLDDLDVELVIHGKADDPPRRRQDDLMRL